MTVEKALTTPFGIALYKTGYHGYHDPQSGKTYAAPTETNSKIIFGSIHATGICFVSKDLFLIPVSFWLTRFTAIICSLWLKNRAFDGVSGKKK
jgi:hypothetical protein